MSKWIPEIVYEEASDDGSSAIPFVMVPADEAMPELIYIFESRETADFEPGPNGEELPIVEWDLHQYADMNILKQNLDLETYDKVRNALGLESFISASEKGVKITDRIRDNLV